MHNQSDVTVRYYWNTFFYHFRWFSRFVLRTLWTMNKHMWTIYKYLFLFTVSNHLWMQTSNTLFVLASCNRTNDCGCFMGPNSTLLFSSFLFRILFFSKKKFLFFPLFFTDCRWDARTLIVPSHHEIHHIFGMRKHNDFYINWKHRKICFLMDREFLRPCC